eukprot:4085863-Amphidinium_carterae.1
MVVPGALRELRGNFFLAVSRCPPHRHCQAQRRELGLHHSEVVALATHFPAELGATNQALVVVISLEDHRVPL